MDTREAKEFINTLHDNADYWLKMIRTGSCSVEEALHGVLFSSLAEIDGVARSAGYDIVSRETGKVINRNCELHGMYYKK